MTHLPRTAAEAAIASIDDEAGKESPKEGIIKKIGRKILERREQRYYRDEEE